MLCKIMKYSILPCKVSIKYGRKMGAFYKHPFFLVWTHKRGKSFDLFINVI